MCVNVFVRNTDKEEAIEGLSCASFNVRVFACGYINIHVYVYMHFYIYMHLYIYMHFYICTRAHTHGTFMSNR